MTFDVKGLKKVKYIKKTPSEAEASKFVASREQSVSS